MTKEKLFDYMNFCLKTAAQTDNRNIISSLYQQAFGATQFYIAFYLKTKEKEIEEERAEILNELAIFGDKISQLKDSIVEEE